MRRSHAVLAATAAAVLAFHLVLAFRWAAIDRQPPGWDPAVHLGTAMDYRQAWRESRWFDLIRTVPRPGHPQYPFFYHYTLTPLLRLADPHRAVVFLNLAYLSILIGAGAWLAFQTGGAWTAAAALVVVGLSPGILFNFREAFPDLALAAWTALTYAIIIRSRAFESRRLAMAAGVSTGFALLSKWGAVVYLIPGAAMGLADARRRRNLLLALGVAAVMCVPWYLVNMATMLSRIWTSVMLGHQQGQPLPWTWENWLSYANMLAGCYSWPALALMLGGSVVALRRWNREGRRGAQGMLAAWLAFSYLFCTLVPSKNPRYFLPAVIALPALAFPALPAPALGLSVALALAHAREMRLPEPELWRQEEILKAVESRRSTSLAGLCVLANHRNVNATALTWLARHMELTSVYIGCHQREIPQWAQFVLVKTGDPGFFLSDETQGILASVRRGDGLFARVFKPAQRWPLPDGSEAVLYEQRTDAPLISRQKRFASLVIKGDELRDVVLTPRGPGRYLLEAGSLKLKKLAAPIVDIKVELLGARLIEAQGKVYVLGLDRVRLLAADADLRALASALTARSRVPITLEAEGSQLKAHLKLGPLPLDLSLRVAQEGRFLRLTLERLALARIPVPYASRVGLDWTLEPHPPYQPYGLELERLRFSSSRINIGDSASAKNKP